MDSRFTGENVVVHDLRKSIPYRDETFDVVYHSHLLEHFPKHHAHAFLHECYRVLRSNGIMRIVVPDLEEIAKTYLKALHNAIAEIPGWHDNYQWIMLEMYDQTVRTWPGGEMAKYLQTTEVPNKAFIINRIGREAKSLMQSRKHQSRCDANYRSRLYKLARPRKWRAHFARIPNQLREQLVKLVLGPEYERLRIGRFRESGEVHHWMYDRYSLSDLMKTIGLVDVKRRSPTESYIPRWADYQLDTDVDGTTYKPDSLYMEGIKR